MNLEILGGNHLKHTTVEDVSLASFLELSTLSKDKQKCSRQQQQGPTRLRSHRMSTQLYTNKHYDLQRNHQYSEVENWIALARPVTGLSES